MKNFSSVLAREWLGNVRVDCLAGLVVAFALIPEAIGFSVVAGVDPKVGLYASVVIACVIAFTGGRVAMISAATASTAVLMGGLVHSHGVQYLFAATILMGLFQILAGVFRLDRLMRFVSRSVITGFVNALAILIFLAQLPQLVHVPIATYGLITLGLAIIFLFPRITRAVPSALVAVVVLTIITAATGLHLRTVASLGQLPSTLPHFGIPQVPFTLETLWLLLPLALTLAAVGLLETQLTAQIVDDMTDTPSGRSRESAGQGIANIAAAFFGGMGGCAMIGQSVINVSSGGRGRLTADTVRKIVGRAGQRAGIEFPVHPHMLRHATGYKLANDGQDTRSIQHYLGHRNIEHTTRYTELKPDRFRAFWSD